VSQLTHPDQDVQIASGSGEGWGLLNALVADVANAGGFVERAARRLLGHDQAAPIRDMDPANEARQRVEQADVVVCASGNLAHVYFARRPGRLTLEAIAAAYPGLIAGLVAKPGIGFML